MLGGKKLHWLSTWESVDKYLGICTMSSPNSPSSGLGPSLNPCCQDNHLSPAWGAVDYHELLQFVLNWTFLWGNAWVPLSLAKEPVHGGSGAIAASRTTFRGQWQLGLPGKPKKHLPSPEQAEGPNISIPNALPFSVLYKLFIQL